MKIKNLVPEMADSNTPEDRNTIERKKETPRCSAKNYLQTDSIHRVTCIYILYSSVKDRAIYIPIYYIYIYNVIYNVIFIDIVCP